jgi:DNA repair protein RecO (recombination protein O)
MEGGNFCSLPPGHPYYLSLPLSSSLSAVLQTLNAGENALNLNYTLRTELLAAMLQYFRIHISGFGEIKSVQVLSDVFSE